MLRCWQDSKRDSCSLRAGVQIAARLRCSERHLGRKRSTLLQRGWTWQDESRKSACASSVSVYSLLRLSLAVPSSFPHPIPRLVIFVASPAEIEIGLGLDILDEARDQRVVFISRRYLLLGHRAHPATPGLHRFKPPPTPRDPVVRER
ncbi:hypothetical protein MSAN_00646200 [Mycena sanguinolenta]|uniref:Uncharacterized protein n=1 Tax=Mycena sanguinolenta TaxID=230812 RepID=A0A8H6YZZ9_9AGAR|nr:hypothetical protein MSAN_00646200 [Mycena sanguinolenta]